MIGTMTAILISAGAAIAAAASGIVGGVTAGVQAAQQKEIADYNAKLARRNAEQANANAAAAQRNANIAAEAEQAEYRQKEMLEREKADRQRSAMLAEIGASGSNVAGSSLLAMVDNSVNAELNALEVRREGQVNADNIRYQGELNAFEQRLNANAFTGQATNYQMQSKAASQNSTMSVIGAGLSGIGKGLSVGASTYGSMSQNGLIDTNRTW